MEYSLKKCTLCPHRCSVNREQGEIGFCRLDAGLHIAKICRHTGEEPIEGSENGVCNVFFSHCNLRCSYCQNYQISQPQSCIIDEITDYVVAVEHIIAILQNGIHFLGFVSPTSHIPQMLKLIGMVHERGFRPRIIYNTNAYENVEVLRGLSSIVDIYLPDFKYADNSIGEKLSGISHYVEYARAAILEMYRQKKAVLSDENPALIIRHLVLPNAIENSRNVLHIIADDCSTNVYLSLMSQYSPVYKACSDEVMNRTLHKEEYDAILQEMESIGFERGWTQLLESNDYYQPDFTKENPFEES